MKFKSLMVGAALLGLQASAASAAVITSWNYTVSSQFVTGSTTTSGSAGTFINTAPELSWGTSTPPTDPATNTARSGLKWSNSPAVGVVTTNGLPAIGNTVTHYNHPIDLTIGGIDTQILTGGAINVQLNLTQLTPAPGNPPPAFQHNLNRDFSFVFVESPNSGGGWSGSNGSDCAIGNTPCPDIFVLTSGSTLDQFLDNDGNLYTLQVSALISGGQAFGPLDDKVCGFAQIAAAVPGCGTGGIHAFGFTTPESADTPVDFSFGITVTVTPPVPEPTAIALFGAGLLGLGWANRRRKSA